MPGRCQNAGDAGEPPILPGRFRRGKGGSGPGDLRGALLHARTRLLAPDQIAARNVRRSIIQIQTTGTAYQHRLTGSSGRSDCNALGRCSEINGFVCPERVVTVLAFVRPIRLATMNPNTFIVSVLLHVPFKTVATLRRQRPHVLSEKQSIGPGCKLPGPRPSIPGRPPRPIDRFGPEPATWFVVTAGRSADAGRMLQ